MRVGALTLGAVLGTGCLLPQEDTLLEDFTPVNRPPRILEDQARLNSNPQRQQEIGNGYGCELHFEAFVEDPDVEQLVRWRWYVDYYTSDLDRTAPVDENVFTNNGKALRPPTRFIVPKLADNPQFRPGVHVVTLMVFDGILGTFDGPGTPPSDPAGVDAGNPFYSTTFDWIVTVNVEDCAQPPPPDGGL